MKSNGYQILVLVIKVSLRFICCRLQCQGCQLKRKCSTWWFPNILI